VFEVGIYWLLIDLPALTFTILSFIANGLALLRDETKMVLLGRHNVGKPKILVYSSSGIQIASLSVSLGSFQPL
jgi:hypothetical protein